MRHSSGMNRIAAITICIALAAVSVLLSTFTIYDDSMAPEKTIEPVHIAYDDATVSKNYYSLKQQLLDTSDEEALDMFISVIRDVNQSNEYPDLIDIIFNIKKQNHGFGIRLSDGSDNDDTRDSMEIYLSRNEVDNNSAGAALHGLGHLLHSVSYGSNMPTMYSTISSAARHRVINEKTEAIGEFFKKLNDYYDALISIDYTQWYDDTPDGIRLRVNIEALYSTDREKIVEILKERYAENHISEYINDRDTAVEKAYEIQRDKAVSEIKKENLEIFAQRSGFRATGSIITALFGTRDIPLDEDGSVMALCSPDITFGHDDAYYSMQQTNRPFTEQLVSFFELKMTNNTGHLDFLHDTLGPEWFELMETQLSVMLS